MSRPLTASANWTRAVNQTANDRRIVLRNVASALGPAARKHQPLAELAIGALIVARSRF